MLNKLKAVIKKALRTEEVELGASGTVIHSGYITNDYISDLSHPQSVSTYDQMRKSDATVQAVLKVNKLPILGSDFYIDIEGDDKKSVEIKEFISDAMFNKIKFKTSFLPQALLMFDFGFMCFEKVFALDENNKYYYKTLAPRLPVSLDKWKQTEGDEEAGMFQSGYKNDDYISSNLIPSWKLVRFALNQEGDNYEGTSLLRSAYKSWYYKSNLEKIGAIAAERGSAGLPLLEQDKDGRPMDEAESEKMNEIMENVRSNASSYITTPAGYKFSFATPGGAFDFHPQLHYHDRQIAESVLAQFIKTGGAGSSGGYAQNKIDIQLFLLSLTQYANYICGRIDELMIKELVDLNFDNVEFYPKMKFKPIELRDMTTFSESLEKLVNSGTLTADVDVENLVRGEMGLPNIEEKEIIAPKTNDSKLSISLDSEKKKLAVSKKDAFRDLTLAEEKLDLDAYRSQFDKGEKEISDTVTIMGAALTSDIMKRSKAYYNGEKFGKLDDKVKEVIKTNTKKLSEQQLEQYEFGKTQAVNEIGVSGRIATPKEVKQVAKDTAALEANKLQQDLESSAQFTVNSAKQKGAKVTESMQAVKAGLDVIVARQAMLFGGLQTSSMINKAKRDVHNEYKNLISFEQYSAIIDSRTSGICRSLDNRVDKVGNLPVPPLHGNCRSTLVSVMKTQDPQPEFNPVPKSVEEKISVDPFKTKAS